MSLLLLLSLLACTSTTDAPADSDPEGDDPYFRIFAMGPYEPGLNVSQADALCQTKGTSDPPGLGGTWRVWMSDSTEDALNHITGTGPWAVVGSTTVAFADHAALGGTSATALNVTIDGDTLPVGSKLQTGTLLGGTVSADTCVDWTDVTTTSTSFFTVGSADTASLWTDDGTPAPCVVGSSLVYLLCFQE